MHADEISPGDDVLVNGSCQSPFYYSTTSVVHLLPQHSCHIKPHLPRSATKYQRFDRTLQADWVGRGAPGGPCVSQCAPGEI